MKTYVELRADVLDKAARDESFRARLLARPKAAVQEATGLALPDSVSIEVHEESASTAHLVLSPSGALTDGDLQRIAAGHRVTDNYGMSVTHEHPDGRGRHT